MLDHANAITDEADYARYINVVRSLAASNQASWRSKRWTRHLIILSGLVLAMLCDAFVAQVLYANYHEAYRAADVADADLARALEEYTLRNMQGVDLLLRTAIDDFRNDPSLLSAGNPALIDELKRRVAPYPAVAAIVVLDAAGNLLADSRGNGVPGREFNFADRSYYQVQRDNPDRGLFIDVPVRARTGAGRLFIAVSRALRAADGRFAGIVFSALDYEGLRQFVLSLNVGIHGAVTLFRDDGRLLLREPIGEELAGQDFSEIPLFREHLQRAPSGDFDGGGFLDAMPRRVSYRRVANMPLVVTIARAPVEFLAGWKNNTLYYTSGAAVLNLLIVGFGFGLARQWRLREASEAVLRENLEQHRLVTENVPALIVHVGADRRVRYANRVALQWYAQPSAAEAPRRIEDLVDPGRLSELRPKIEAVLTGRMIRGEEKALFPDGQERWCDTTRVPDIGHDGVVRGYFLLSIDITERKRIEDELRQAQKIEAVGQLAGGIAHDSNNMLAATVGNLDILLEALPPGDVKCRALTERAIEAAERVADLNRRLLAFARKQTLRPQITDVNQLVSGMTAILRRTLGEEIEIELRQSDEPCSCLIDPAQLQNALLNLALNARDAMAGRGRLTIMTKRATLDRSAEEGAESVVPGDYVAIAVSDLGAGMPLEIARRAFEPFFTTKEVGKGSGLGLSMVYGFARQSGGTVRISSKVAQGTTVTLYLPSAAPAEDRHGRADNIEPSRRGAGERILVVEDNPLVGRMASNMLSSMGYHPIVVTDASSATAEIERADHVALLLTDVILPGGTTGFDLARQARRTRPNLPVLFISGFADPSLVPDDFRAGTILLTKPFRGTQLSDAVAAALTEAKTTP
jgi:PAS domain S-box-containing protein